MPTSPKVPYRDFHLIQLFAGYEEQPLPLDLFLYHYFRKNKSLGPKDRAYIAENVFGLIRWRALVDYVGGSNLNWKERIDIWKKLNPRDYLKDRAIPLHVRISMPELLFQKLDAAYGTDRAIEMALICNTQAPTTVRANLLKTTRDDLLNHWQRLYEVSPCLESPWGIIFHKRENFFTLPEFEQGLFEVQDEGSQLLAALVEAAPGQQVCDFCAGSGGKTLAFGALMQNRGQIYLHDVRFKALQEARKRMSRAGLQNVQFVKPDSRALRTLSGRMDWVLVDAPCSGTGTLRRNPDMKWRFTPETLPKLVTLQREIFTQALTLLKPKGKIVYSTCSLLPEENEEQMEFLCKTHGLTPVSPPLKTFLSEGGMDGFFGVTLEKA